MPKNRKRHQRTKPKPIPIFVVDPATNEPTDLLHTAGTVKPGSDGQPTVIWKPGAEPTK